MKALRLFLILPTALILSSCTSTLEIPDLGTLYNASAQYHGIDRNPVIVIPGIMGSKLVDPDDGTVVWGAFLGEAVDATKPDGARTTALPLKMGVPLAELKDNLKVDGALDHIKLSVFKLPIELQAYSQILASLGAGGYRDQSLAEAIDYGEGHFTCFQFAYDWRRSNVENAALLKQFILDKKAYVESEMTKRFGVENPTVKFDIVAHSMGGIVSRYFLRYGDQPLPEDGSLPDLTWEGTEHIDSLTMVGTPNSGSTAAITQLNAGLVRRPLVNFQAAIIGTFPAIYELVPRPRHGTLIDTEGQRLDVYDVENWEKNGWGMLAPNQDDTLAWLLPDETDPAARHAIAKDQVAKSLKQAKQLHEALDVPASTPEGFRIELYAGDAILMPAVLQVLGPGKGFSVAPPRCGRWNGAPVQRSGR